MYSSRLSAIEHRLDLLLDINLQMSGENGLPPQEAHSARRGLSFERDQPHQGLAGTSDHHRLDYQNRIHSAGEVVFCTVEVDHQAPAMMGTLS